MPDAERLTVTSALVGFDSVPVKVRLLPASSEIEEALEVRVNVGAESSFVIVMVSCWVPFSEAPPPLTLSMSTTTVSSASNTASLLD